MENDRQSWILALRGRLSSPPPRRLPASEARPASVLVPLYVDAGEPLDRPHQARGRPAEPPRPDRLPGGGRDSRGSLGRRPARGPRGDRPRSQGRSQAGRARPAGEPGRLPGDPLRGRDPPGANRTPNAGEIAEVFPIPLTAFANPRMVEEREVLLNGVPRNLLIYHVGNRQIWGLTARVLQNLLVRLGLESEPED